jgi:outer membrane protein assembly factor BamD (BamD/ComL family)
MVCLALFAAFAAAQEGQTVRPQVGTPLQAAVELLKAKKNKEALAKAREAQAVSGKTPYETYLATRVLAQASAAAGEPDAAASAFEAAAAAAAAPEAERRQFLAAAAGQYYLAKDYPKAADAAARYFKQGGTDKSVRTVYVQALYLGGNYAAAAKAIAADVEAEEQAGKTPPEDQLQLLANAYLQNKDNAGYGRAMEKLVTHYPKREYWLPLVHGISTLPGFSERLAIDLARFKLETGTMRSAQEYLEAAQLSLIDGFPVEAARTIDKGYAAGALGTGAEAARHKRLKDMAAKSVAEDKKSLDTEAAAKDAKALFNEGFNLVLNGRSEKGLDMMERAVRQGVPGRRADHAKLQLGYAYHLAGQNPKALQILRTVQGGDGSGALARAWVIRLGSGARGGAAPS